MGNLVSQIGIDEHLRPVKDSDGTMTSLEVSTDTVRVKNLVVAGKVEGSLEVDTITTETDLTLDSGGDIILNTGDHDIFLEYNGADASKIYTSATLTKLMGVAGNHGIEIESTGTGNIVLDSNGDIDISSNDGNFIMRKGTTEFSAANSSYAGMILGYTVIGLDATPATFDVTNAMLPVHDDLKVSFTFPPSGKVEIMASIYIQSDNARDVTFGLSTTDASTGFTSLGAKYENTTYYGDETDGEQHSHRWYVTGTAGDAEELWFSAGCTQALRIDLFWGGDSSSVADSTHPMEYQPFIMKATALPSTIYTG